MRPKRAELRAPRTKGPAGRSGVASGAAPPAHRSNATPGSAYQQSAFTNGYEFTSGTGYALPEYPFLAPPDIGAKQLVHHPIVVVGGGLAGLSFACALAVHGVKCVLLDEDNSVGVKGASSRGICYTQKSLEFFHRLGIYERVAAKGIQWSVGRTFAGDDEVYSFDLRSQSAYSLSRQPPFINIQQFYVEGFLVERIMQLGKTDLRWKNRLIGFEQNQDFATLRVQTPAGDYALRASHVIDATGSASPLRQWLDVPFKAKRGDDRWCIADVRFSKHPPVERHTWIEAPFNENRAVWQHLMADDVWRIDYQMAPDSDPVLVGSQQAARERLAQQFGADAQIEIVWVGPYAYRSECVDHMRCGRVFFMGDSAKIVNPFGARGGNTGLSDADNLAWKLAAVLQGRASARLLESYHQERHEAATQNVLVTNRTGRFLRPQGGVERVLRAATIALAKRYPFARQLINTGRMAVANRYTQSSVCAQDAGISAQNVALRWADGSAGVLNELILWAGPRLLLLLFGPLAPAQLRRLQRLVARAPLRAVQVLQTGQSADVLEHVIDVHGHLAQACGVTSVPSMTRPSGAAGMNGRAKSSPGRSDVRHDSDALTWVLLRPDAYRAASGQDIDTALIRATQQALSLEGEVAP